MVSLILSLSLIAVFDGVVASPVEDVAPWVVGLGVAYGLVYGRLQSRIAEHVRPDSGGPERGNV